MIVTLELFRRIGETQSKDLREEPERVRPNSDRITYITQENRKQFSLQLIKVVRLMYQLLSD